MPESPAMTEKVIEFYELVYLYYVVSHSFDKAEQKFSLLEFYYKAHGSIAANQADFVSLHLLYLFSSNKEVDYYCILENLDHSLRESPQVQKIITFTEMINMGNYTTAIAFARSISAHHALVISRFEETKVQENCKLVDLFSNDINIEDVARFFNIKDAAELENLRRYVDDLFEVR